MSDTEVLVKVEGLSKKFCKDMRTGLWYGVQDLFTNFIGNKKNRTLRDKEFWALQDINFELRRGECLGLIGHNGAGKSTLLKILNGLIKPDAGKVTIKGRVGALIELGAGFNPILTGRENIYNNGAVLGFTRKEIDEKLDEIIDFAEVRDFVDMPVQHYSSGMRIRLGFAVAIHMQPDVLLIDEVLAVGDIGFALKCFKIIDKISPTTAIIFVSHSMPLISRISSRCILLEKGEVIFHDHDVSATIDNYYKKFVNNEASVVYDDGTLKVNEIKIINSIDEKDLVPKIKWGGDLKIKFELLCIEKYEKILLRVIILDKEQRPVAIIEDDVLINPFNKTLFSFNLCHNKIELSKGVYSINLAIFKINSNEPIYRVNGILDFQIIHEKDVWTPFLLKAEYMHNS